MSLLAEHEETTKDQDNSIEYQGESNEVEEQEIQKLQQLPQTTHVTDDVLEGGQENVSKGDEAGTNLDIGFSTDTFLENPPKIGERYPEEDTNLKEDLEKLKVTILLLNHSQFIIVRLFEILEKIHFMVAFLMLRP